MNEKVQEARTEQNGKEEGQKWTENIPLSFFVAFPGMLHGSCNCMLQLQFQKLSYLVTWNFKNG